MRILSRTHDSACVVRRQTSFAVFFIKSWDSLSWESENAVEAHQAHTNSSASTLSPVLSSSRVWRVERKGVQFWNTTSAPSSGAAQTWKGQRHALWKSQFRSRVGSGVETSFKTEFPNTSDCRLLHRWALSCQRYVFSNRFNGLLVHSSMAADKKRSEQGNFLAFGHACLSRG